MRDPVIAADGYSYERASITQWIDSSTRQGIAVISPMSGEPLASLHLLPNRSLRSTIQDLVAKSPALSQRASAESAELDASPAEVNAALIAPHGARAPGPAGNEAPSHTDRRPHVGSDRGEVRAPEACPECFGRGCLFCGRGSSWEPASCRASGADASAVVAATTLDASAALHQQRQRQ